MLLGGRVWILQQEEWKGDEICWRWRSCRKRGRTVLDNRGYCGYILSFPNHLFFAGLEKAYMFIKHRFLL